MSAPKLSRTALATAGIEHIKTRLDWNKPLREALKVRIQDDGEAWTWAPPGANLNLMDLHDSDLPDGVTQQMHWDLMTDFVVEYLSQDGRLAIIEDDSSTPTDPWLTKERLVPINVPKLGVADDLYWYVTQPDRGAVQDLMRWGFSLFKTMALTRPTSQWPPAHAVTLADVQCLANTADHIVVDAFDFDGFVVWSAAAIDIS
jgi:hypothetical protein